MKDSFSLTGTLRGKPYTISWEAGVFDDPLGDIGVLIAAHASVELTPTGPSYSAASSPASVALVTALTVFDSRPSIVLDTQAQAIIDALYDDLAVPAEAVT